MCDSEKTFEGKLVVLWGDDFRQILLVGIHESHKSIIEAILHRASFWNECSIMHLYINMRLQRVDESTIQRLDEFVRWIFQVVEGELQGISISDDGEANLIKIFRIFSYIMMGMVCKI